MDWKRTLRLIPNGVQTESKRPERHVPGVYPKYVQTGKGAYITCDGKEYLDYSCALGAVVLGYGFDPVTEAVCKVVRYGNLFNLPHLMESELAEIIIDMIPSAQKVRFLKTGSEACSAAVRIARAYTGRDMIICMGYHGWHDWYQSTADSNTAGIPKSQDVIRADHGIPLKGLFAKHGRKIAAVIMEPYIWKQLDITYLRKLKHLCTKNGTVLIFDECITGIRSPKFSAQAHYEVMPDLTCLSKAMGNGFPISCVCGNADLMNLLAKDVFVSGTFNADLVGIAAAIATLKFMRDRNVPHILWTIGGKLQGIFNSIVNLPGLVDKFKADGLPCRPRFVFPTREHKTLFWQECFKRGLLLDDAQFISYSHKQPELDKSAEIMRGAMHIVRKYVDDPTSVLEGEVCSEV